ncbi:unnamed protein product [Macrosiphum euphorbiae]|uniref:CCHC-type domain-containing protein n=1 Tax=Macrosiphum euphorbiae TaxID=13131 RepID=A0AAV0VSB7_9HEMI|nr:unnamed protein product [Macrosiphum euphorbiae]
MDGKSIKSPKSITKTYMSKFPSSKFNSSVPRHTTTLPTSNRPTKSSPTTKVTQTAQPPSHKNIANDTPVKKNTIECTNILSNTPTINTSNSFAVTTAKSNYPKMNQAIVLYSIDGVRQVEYITAISKLTEPSNIIAASRISKNRFCIFFKNETIANNLVENHAHIEIDSNIIPIRKLINPSKRIILSNVYPSIPDGIIISALQDAGIRLTSNVSPLRAGFASEEFSHITSFRRQVYINPDDANLVPSTIPINFENIIFHIFPTDDTVTCFRCKQTGHISSSCTNQMQSTINNNLTHASKPTNENETSNLTEGNLNDELQLSKLTLPQPVSDTQTSPTTDPIQHNISISSTAASTPDHNIDNFPPLNAEMETNLTDTRYKRPASSTSPKSTISINSSMDLIDLCDNNNAQNNKTDNKNHVIKKMRTKSDSTPPKASPEHDTDKLDDQLYPTLDSFTESAPINYYQFKHIVESSSNKNVNINALCDDSGISVSDLLDFLESIRPKLTDRNIKTKLTKLRNLLFRIMPSPNNNN